MLLWISANAALKWFIVEFRKHVGTGQVQPRLATLGVLLGSTCRHQHLLLCQRGDSLSKGISLKSVQASVAVLGWRWLLLAFRLGHYP